MLKGLGYYLVKGIFPWPQSHFVAALPSGLYATLAIAVALALLGLGLSLPATRRLTVVAGALMALPLAPALMLTGRGVGEIVLAERMLYLPSVGLALLLGAGLAAGLASARARLAVVAASAVVLAAYGVGTVKQVAIWRDETTFWDKTVNSSPETARNQAALYFQGGIFENNLQLEDAERVYRRALDPDTVGAPEMKMRITHSLGSTYLNRAIVATQKNRLEEAAQLVAEAQRILRNVEPYLKVYPEAMRTVAIVSLTRLQIEAWRDRPVDANELQKTYMYLRQALDWNPRDMDVRERLALCEEMLRTLSK
jgi:tetratricopeptide (TPR) repeat protein